MELPGNLEEDYDRGIEVTVKADPKKGVYIAYCAEFDEEIEFSARREVDGQMDQTGGNCRGYSVLKNFQPHTAKSLILRISCFAEKF
ncbi:MAG: hypothetical protein K2P59_07880 [Acetatifactor sp.]|nr:hypothetical protein [Acetatifactor sp.]